MINVRILSVLVLSTIFINLNFKHKKKPLHINLWHKLQTNFQLTYPKNYHIAKAIISYKKQQHSLLNTCINAKSFLQYIVHELEKRNMPGELALLPIIESTYNIYAHSPKGAVGLWQLKSKTGRSFGLKISYYEDERYDGYASTNAALNYLQSLYNRFDDWLLAIAAYNAGESRVQQAISRNRLYNLPTDFWSLSLPQETKNFVPKLLALAYIFSEETEFFLPHIAIS